MGRWGEVSCPRSYRKKSVAELGLEVSMYQLLPVSLPGVEGIYIRALVEKGGEKG